MTPRFTAAVESTEGRGSGYVDVARAVSGLVIDPPAPPEPPRLTGEVAGVPDSLAGGHEVTAEFQSFLDRVPPGSEVRFPGGNPRYKVEGVLVIDRRPDTALRCVDTAEIFAETDGSSHPAPEPIWLAKDWPKNRGRIVIRDSPRGVIGAGLILDGGDPSPSTSDDYDAPRENQHGIRFLSSPDWAIEGEPGRPVEIRNVRGDFLYFGKATFESPWSTRIAGRHLKCRGAGRMGVAYTAASDILLEHFECGLVRRSLLDFEPNDKQGGALRVWIRRGQFGSKGLNFVAGSGAGANMDHILIEDHDLVGANMGVRMGNPNHRRGPIAFRRITTDTPLGNPDRPPTYASIMVLENFDGVEVVYCDMVAQPRRNMWGVSTLNCTRVSVHDNEIENGVGEWREVA